MTYKSLNIVNAFKIRDIRKTLKKYGHFEGY